MKASLVCLCAAVAAASPPKAFGEKADKKPSPAEVKKSEPKVLAKKPEGRELRRRALRITDENFSTLPELHVSVIAPTTIALPVPIAEPVQERVIVSTPEGYSAKLTSLLKRTIVITSAKDLPKGLAGTLTVVLADNTTLSFKLVSSPDVVDLQVDVELLLEKIATDAPEALARRVTELQAQVDDCAASASDAGVRSIAALLAEADFLKRELTISVRGADAVSRQNQLLAESHKLVRILNHGFLLVTVENRASREWVLDKAELVLVGDEETADVRVLHWATDNPRLADGATGKLSVAFVIPPQRSGETFTLRLFEKNGSRHVELEGLKL